MADFQFVNSTSADPSVPQDRAVRALIRKQAMKQASATRRREGTYGKHNRRQYPIFVQDDSVGCPARELEDWHVFRAYKCQHYDVDGKTPSMEEWQEKSPKEGDQKWPYLSDGIVLKASLGPILSCKGYELMTVKYGFDVLDLATLASFHVGRAAGRVLSSDPSQLLHLLRLKESSYLSYLPGRYGHIPCLNDAVECLVARVRQILSPVKGSWEAMVIPLYVKALDSLQRALESPSQRLQPEVLCATEILALYELLDSSGLAAWIRHAAGATRLIQLRGPKQYTTEFEKALFLAHAGPIMTEAILNNEKCFLSQPAWQAVFCSLITPSILHNPLSDRSETVILLLMLKARVSSLSCTVHHFVCSSPSPLTMATTQTYPHPPSSLVSSLTTLQTDLLAWHTRYTAFIPLLPPVLPHTLAFDKRAELHSTYLSCMMLTNRLISALCRSRRRELEPRTQVLAKEMLDLGRETEEVSPYARLFMAQTMAVARATRRTAKEWGASGGGVGEEDEEEEEEGAGKEGVIARWKFERWCALWGRKA